MAGISKTDARNELWKRGALHTFKLDENQKGFEEKIKNTKDKVVVILCSRRQGKTYWALTHSIATCLKAPNVIVKFVAPTKNMLRDIIEPLMIQILEDCPDELRPQYLKNRTTYKFTNGSMLQMAGTDNGHAEKLRGGFAHLCIVDEGQTCNDLTNTIRSILIPTTATTGGKIIILGTAPEDTEHEFNFFIEDADLKGNLIKKTIYKNPRMTKEIIEDIAASYPGGKNDPAFRREYLCEIIKNEKYSALPEFTEQLEKEIVKDWKRPPFYDYYESMDLGGKDLTVVLFAYFDFRNAVVVIEDEIIMNFQEKDQHIKTLVKNIQDKERERFSDPLVHEVREPYLRVSDLDYIALKEIREHSYNKINFMTTKKDEKEVAVNNLRIMLNNKRIIINPRCSTLIKHLRNVKWNKNRKNVFARSPDFGHYDAVDALIYLVRSVVYGKNPYPAHYDLNQKDLVLLGNNNQPKDNAVEIFRAIFKVGKKYGR